MNLFSRWASPMVFLGTILALATMASASPTIMVVAGAAGNSEYKEEFAASANLWKKWADEAGAKSLLMGLDPQVSQTDRQCFELALENEVQDHQEELWIILLGHGTFDGKEAKFNLNGPDFSADDLAGWLKPFQRPVILINASSCSAPFINKLSAPGRVIITGTKSGHQANFSIFGRYLSKTIADPRADLDQDGQTSLLEGFLAASDRVAEFYRSEKRLATEHALLDDNGDGLGTPASAFHGTRLTKNTENKAESEGARAHQFHILPSPDERQLPAEFRKKRNELELQLVTLRDRKKDLLEDQYYASLEQLLLQIASLYEQQK